MSRPTYEELKDRYNNYQTMHPQEDAISLAIWAMDQIQYDQCYQPEGVLTFEEINGRSLCAVSNDNVRHIIRLVRQGMVPEASSILIPKEPTWPNNADHIEVAYYDGYGEYILNGTIKIINRSKPQWAPEDSDLVACWADDDLESSIIDAARLFELYGDDWDHFAKIEQLSDVGHDIAWFKANRPWK